MSHSKAKRSNLTLVEGGMAEKNHGTVSLIVRFQGIRGIIPLSIQSNYKELELEEGSNLKLETSEGFKFRIVGDCSCTDSIKCSLC